MYNPDYENTLMRESIIQFKNIRQHWEKMSNLSKKDKITFSILKWIFNAIQKNNLVEREELMNQLSKNEEIIGMLGYDSIDEV